MNGLTILIPVALLLGGSWLASFFWALRSGQFEDLEGAALRIFVDEGTLGSLGSNPPPTVLGDAEAAPVCDGRQRRTTERPKAAAASTRRAAELARLRFERREENPLGHRCGT